MCARLTNSYALLQKSSNCQRRAGTGRDPAQVVAHHGQAAASVQFSATRWQFDPSPFNEDGVPEPVLKALASKEAGPLPPRLDAAGLEALIVARAGVSLPDRNPNR